MLHFSLYCKLWQVVIILTLQAINLGVPMGIWIDCKPHSYKVAEIQLVAEPNISVYHTLRHSLAPTNYFLRHCIN